MNYEEKSRLKEILGRILRAEEDCRKVKSMQAQLIVNRDALAFIKYMIEGYFINDELKQLENKK